MLLSSCVHLLTSLTVFHISECEDFFVILWMLLIYITIEKKTLRGCAAACVQYFCCLWHSVEWHAAQTTRLANAGTHLWTAPRRRHFIQWCVLCTFPFTLNIHLESKHGQRQENMFANGPVSINRFHWRQEGHSEVPRTMYLIFKQILLKWVTLLQSVWENHVSLRPHFNNKVSVPLSFQYNTLGTF